MSAITGFCPNDTWLTFAASIIIQVTAISGLALAAIKLAGERRPALRHTLGVTALMIILLGPLIVWISSLADIAIIPASFPTMTVFQTGAVRATLNAVPSDITAQFGPETHLSPKPVAMPETPYASVKFSRHRALLYRSLVPGIFTLTWLAGVAVLFIRLVYGMGYQRACCHRSKPLNTRAYHGAIQNTAAILGQSLPPIFVSRLVDLPLAAGWFRPRVLLPEGLPERINGRQLEYILLHECAHILRGDQWIGLAQRVVEMIFWFHPFIHMLNRQIGRAREEVCDNYALQKGGGEDYAQTLLQLAEFIPQCSHVPATAGLIGPKWKLEERIKGILDKRRQIMTHINRLVTGLAAVVFIGIAVLSSVKAENGDGIASNAASVASSESSRQEVEAVMLRFTEYKIKQMDDLAAKLNLQIPDEFQRMNKSIQENASWGDVAEQYKNLKFRSGQYPKGKLDPTIRTPLWGGPVLELFGAYEQVKTWEPALLKLYADLILTNLPAGSIYMGGTDAGRFVPTMFRYGQGSPDVYIITQNALCDNTYADYIRAVYGQAIKIPTSNEVQNVFKVYFDKVKSGELPKIADVGITTNGQCFIRGVAGLMQVNGMLARQIYDANKQERPVFIEESYTIDWMYPYLAPYGVIMRLMPDKVTLTDDMIANDTRYWESLCRELISRSDFAKDVMAQKAFAKMRCAQAGIYAFHHRYDLAESAFKQALELYVLSPETNFRLADFYLQQGKAEQAREVMARYHSKEPGDEKAGEFIKKINDTITKAKQKPE